MKTRVLLYMALLIGLMAHSQDWSKWSIDVGVGNHQINDASYTKNTDFRIDSHWDLGVRYNYNETFGIGLRYARNVSDGWSEEFGVPTDFFYIPSHPFELTYNRLSMEITADLFDIVGLYSEKLALLAHGGGGIGMISGGGLGPQDTDETMGMVTGGFTFLYKLNDRLALKADYSAASHIDQKRSLDGVFLTNAEGNTSNVHSGSIGLMIYLGKDKTPVDFYVPNNECDCEEGDTIVNKYITNKTEVTKIIKEEYEPSYHEYVFFDHDKEDIRSSELNAIYQIYVALQEKQDSKVTIRGWASHTKSSAKYNLALSERRCKEIARKLNDMGIPLSRMVIDPSGKDYHLDNINVHDLARRVELIVD